MQGRAGRLLFALLIAGLVLAVVQTRDSGRAEAGARGEPPATIGGKPYRDYLNSHDYFDLLAKEVMDYEIGFGPCRAPRNVTRVQLGRPQIPMPVGKLGILPQWLEVLKISGCGTTHMRNVLVVYHNGKVVPLPLLPGTGLSRFDIILQRDVLLAVVRSERAFAAGEGCENDLRIALLATDVISREDRADGFHWSEGWTIRNCNEEKRLTISFSPRPDGGIDFDIRQPAPLKPAPTPSPSLPARQ